MCLNKKSRRKFLADALFWTALPTVGVVALAHVSPAAASYKTRDIDAEMIDSASRGDFGNWAQLHREKLSQLYNLDPLDGPLQRHESPALRGAGAGDVEATNGNERESPRLPSIKTTRLHKANKGTHRKPLARPAQPAKTGGRG